MEVSSTREERFVSKLVQDTKKGELEWIGKPNSTIISPSNDRVISKVYTAKISEKKLRIYEFQTKYYRDEEDWEWVKRVRLELVDNEEATLFEFGYDYSLYKLFNAVRKLNSGVNDLMKGFLDE